MTARRQSLHWLATLALGLQVSLTLAQTAAIAPEVQAAAKVHITAAALEAPVRFLASDALEGRGPATRGDVLARTYIASELHSMGLHPGGPGGKWEQPFDIVGV